MSRKLRVDVSKNSNAREYIKLIEKLNKNQTSNLPFSRSRVNSNIVLLEPSQISAPAKHRKGKNNNNKNEKLKGKNGQISIVMAK